MEGWISVYRKFTEWEWYKDTNVKAVFLHFLLMANHKEGKWKGQTIQRGQLITSLDHLHRDIGLTVPQIRTAIKKLKLTGEITTKSTNQNTTITIVKYDSYQDNNFNYSKQNSEQVNNRISNEEQADNKQIATNNNDNNDNNIIYFNLLKKYKNKDNIPAGLEVIRNVRADEDYNKLSTDDKISLEMELTI